MKFNFRKIASVLASTVMLSSTVALAAAANYPAPFVQNGVADVAVVYGSSAAQTDLVAATDITTNLNSKLAAASSGPTTVAGGDFVKLEKATNMFNLGESMNDFYSTLDEEELSVVLAKGTYLNDANNEFEYDQKIALGELNLTFFQNNDFNDEKPLIGFDLVNSDHILNYTLDFTPDSAEGGTGFEDLETTDITMLGRSYYIVKADAVATNSIKLTLLDSANSALITEGEVSSISVAGSSYDVSTVYISETNVILNVNGVQTNKLAEGDVFKVGTDLYVGVKNILYSGKESGISKVEISLGSGKIVMENGQEVEINNEAVSDMSDSVLTAYITNETTNIDKIVLQWSLEDDAWIAPGSDLVLPGFETIKLSMGGFVEPAKEMTSLADDGDESIKLTTEVTDGKVSLNLLYTNASGSGFAGLGKDSDSKLVTSATSSITVDKDTDDWFVATWISGDNSESYVLKLDSIDESEPAKNTTTLSSVASGSTKGLVLDIGETDEIGEVALTLNYAQEDYKNITLTASAAGGSGSVSLNKLVTKDGLKIQLPVVDLTTVAASRTGDMINTTANPITWVMNFTEEDEDGNINVGDSFTATIGLTSGNEVQVSSVSVTDYDAEEGSDLKVGYVDSSLATKTTLDEGGDPDTLDIEYHGSESYAEVYVSETSAAVVTGEEGSKVLAVKDSESVSAKNLVVVGGSCINSVAAELLGGALCGADFEAKAVGAGSFLIETFARDGGGVATLVAGYNAQDTTNAAKYLTTQVVDTTVGMKYKGTTSTSAELVVA